MSGSPLENVLFLDYEELLVVCSFLCAPTATSVDMALAYFGLVLIGISVMLIQLTCENKVGYKCQLSEYLKLMHHRKYKVSLFLSYACYIVTTNDLWCEIAVVNKRGQE